MEYKTVWNMSAAYPYFKRYAERVTSIATPKHRHLDQLRNGVKLKSSCSTSSAGGIIRGFFLVEYAMVGGVEV